MGQFLINGKSFAMDRVDLQTVVGRVELWDFINTTMMDHPMHIHGTQFQVLGQTIAGVATPADYLAWRDTVNVPAGTTVTIKTRQTMPGRRYDPATTARCRQPSAVRRKCSMLGTGSARRSTVSSSHSAARRARLTTMSGGICW